MAKFENKMLDIIDALHYEGFYFICLVMVIG